MASSDGWEDVPLSEDGWEDVPLAPAKANQKPGGPQNDRAPGFALNLARQVRQGANPFWDEMAGVAEATGGSLQRIFSGDIDPSLDGLKRNAEQTLADYRTGRDESRAIDNAGAKAFPKSSLAANVAGALLVPVPGSGAAKGAGFLARARAAAGAGAKVGGLYGLGSSEADLTRGDIGGASLDTLAGTAAGTVGGALGEGVASGGRWLVKALRKRAGRGIEEAIERQTTKELNLAEKNIASQQGSYRSAVQSASRDLEVMAREAAELPPGPLKDQLTQMLNSPEGLAVREQVAGNKLTTAPERIAEMREKLAQLQSLIAGKEANVALQTKNALQDPMRRHVLPRVWTLGHRMLPLGGMWLGNKIGGDEGAAIGALTGAAMSLTQGAPGRIVKNLIESPAVRKAAWEKVLTATGGKAPEQLAVVRALRGYANGGGLAPAGAAAAESQGFSPLLLRLVAGKEGEDDGTRSADAAAEKATVQARALRRSR